MGGSVPVLNVAAVLQDTGMGVFTPVLPSLAGWVGDVPVFQEMLRWFGGDDPLDVAEARPLLRC